MKLLLAGVLFLAFGSIVKLIPTKHNTRDERVIAYNKALNPLMTAMIVAGVLLIIAGLVTRTL